MRCVDRRNRRKRAQDIRNRESCQILRLLTARRLVGCFILSDTDGSCSVQLEKERKMKKEKGACGTNRMARLVMQAARRIGGVRAGRFRQLRDANGEILKRLRAGEEAGRRLAGRLAQFEPIGVTMRRIIG
jgi:hypothetical protein